MNHIDIRLKQLAELIEARKPKISSRDFETKDWSTEMPPHLQCWLPVKTPAPANVVVGRLLVHTPPSIVVCPGMSEQGVFSYYAHVSQRKYGPPPHVGWWLAARQPSEHPDGFRYWDGSRWSSMYKLGDYNSKESILLKTKCNPWYILWAPVELAK